MRPRLLLAAAALLTMTACRRQPCPDLLVGPRTILWAWETPEDLRALDPTTGIAFLSREVTLGTHAQLHPRKQPLALPSDPWLMAVVRLEPTTAFADTPALRQETAAAILTALQVPNLHALQIDFDATASQQSFYAAVLASLRARLPAKLPLSVTALVSWCGRNSWLGKLPANARPEEAVPMFFRMGGPASTRSRAPRNTANVTEPLCQTSIGVATDEAWPDIHTGRRVYVFRKGPWTGDDIRRLNARGYQGLREVSAP